MQISINDVASVYSGINGRCCCGCSGKHTYASTHKDWSSKNRGYQVTDDDINDKTVKLIVNKMSKLPPDHVNPAYVSVVSGNRLYIAYFKH